MQAASVAQNLIENATTGVGTAVDIRGITPFSIYVRGNGPISAGAVQLETSHDKDYTGAWAVLGAPVVVPGNGEAIYSTNIAVAAIRARVATTIVGGTVTCFLVGGTVA